MIRVGRRIYTKNGQFIDPEMDGFKQIFVLTKSYKDWWELSPYALKNDKDQIMENVWQFSKVYKDVPKRTAKYSRYDDRIIWQHPAEVHMNEDGTLKPEYWAWREKGMAAEDAIRYPVGFYHRHNCQYALTEPGGEKLDYVQSRKAIYVPLYIDLVKKEEKFKKLKKMYEDGENLLIIEVDGPHQESIQYYMDKYGVKRDFFVNSTVEANEESMKILLNDEKHAFGHGYCLAMALLDINV